MVRGMTVEEKMALQCRHTASLKGLGKGEGKGLPRTGHKGPEGE